MFKFSHLTFRLGRWFQLDIYDGEFKIPSAIEKAIARVITTLVPIILIALNNYLVDLTLEVTKIIAT